MCIGTYTMFMDCMAYFIRTPLRQLFKKTQNNLTITIFLLLDGFLCTYD